MMRALIVTMCLLASASQAQWQRTAGPCGGPFYDAVEINGVQYLGTFGGVYRSSNAGGRWEAIGLTGKMIYRLAGSGSLLLAAVDTVLWRSSNAGNSWDSVMAFDGVIRSIAFLGDIPFVSLAGVVIGSDSTGGGVYRSRDGGITWSNSGSGMGRHLYVRGLLASGNAIVAVSYRSGIYRSLDSGATWSLRHTPSASSERLWASNVNAGRLVVGGTSRTLLVSSDNGASWVAKGCEGMSESATIYTVGFIGQLGIAGTLDDTTYLTNDGGATWTIAGGQFTQGTTVYSVKALGGELAIGSYLGPLYGSDGFLWTPRREGMTASYVPALAIQGGTIFAGSAWGIQSSTDSGATWVFPGGTDASVNKDIHAFYKVYGTLCATSSGGTLTHTDAGRFWRGGGGSNTGAPYTIAQIGSTLFGDAGIGVVKSTDLGSTWILTTPPSDSVQVTHVLEHGGDLYAATVQSVYDTLPSALGGVWRSRDLGDHWQFVSTGLPGDMQPSSFVSMGSKMYIGTWTGVYESTDGSRWIHLPVLDTSVYAFVLPPLGSSLFVYENGLGTVRSVDGGNTWSRIDQGLFDQQIFSLVANSTYMFGGVGDIGVWRRPISEVGVRIPPSSNTPSSISLEQNHPNPVSGNEKRTTIGYSLVESEHVVLTVCDLLGREISMLVDRDMHPGRYEVDLRTTGLRAGTYQYTLRIGERVETKRLEIVE
jgi:photosystem II stability/assembly factor-like uncharacterized protein